MTAEFAEYEPLLPIIAKKTIDKENEWLGNWRQFQRENKVVKISQVQNQWAKEQFRANLSAIANLPAKQKEEFTALESMERSKNLANISANSIRKIRETAEISEAEQLTPATKYMQTENNNAEGYKLSDFRKKQNNKIWQELWELQDLQEKNSFCSGGCQCKNGEQCQCFSNGGSCTKRAETDQYNSQIQTMGCEILDFSSTSCQAKQDKYSQENCFNENESFACNLTENQFFAEKSAEGLNANEEFFLNDEISSDETEQTSYQSTLEDNFLEEEKRYQLKPQDALQTVRENALQNHNTPEQESALEQEKYLDQQYAESQLMAENVFILRNYPKKKTQSQQDFSSEKSEARFSQSITDLQNSAAELLIARARAILLELGAI